MLLGGTGRSRWILTSISTTPMVSYPLLVAA
jgi:hypothetical protein